MRDTIENRISAEPVIDSNVVRGRALAGIKALTARTFASQVLRIISSLCLARLLVPADYGIFAVAAFVTGLGMYLGDMGLGAALVQEHHEPSEDETVTVFWSHQLFTLAIVCVLLVASPIVVRLEHLPTHGVALLSVMAVGLFLVSLRVMPIMMLERNLRFSAIARCELIENIAQTSSTIIFAFLHWGAWALVGGGLVRGFVGLILIWLASPWRPKGKFRFSIVKRLLSFGLAFQISALVPIIAGGWMPVIVGRVLGLVAVGLVGWAMNLASTPLMLSAVFNRVAFPAYSRLRSDPDALAHYLQLSVRRLSSVFWIAVPTIVIIIPLVLPVVFGSRWTPAITLVQWLSIECVFLTLTGLMVSVQNATGRSGERLGVALGIGLVRWLLAYVAVTAFGINAIGPAMCIASFTELLVSTYLIKKYNQACVSLATELFQPILATAVVLLLSIGTGHLLAHGVQSVAVVVSLATFVLLTGVRECLMGRSVLLGELRALRLMLRPSSD